MTNGSDYLTMIKCCIAEFKEKKNISSLEEAILLLDEWDILIKKLPKVDATEPLLALNGKVRELVTKLMSENQKIKTLEKKMFKVN